MGRRWVAACAALWGTAALSSSPVAAVAAPQAGAAPPTIESHRPLHPPLVSTLPEPAMAGDPATRLARAYGGTPIDVTTYHYDSARTGWNRSETDLTPASVASNKFGRLATLKVDGNVFAEPLLVSNYVMPDKTTHDILIVATGHDSVYAFDAQTYTVLWQISMGAPQSTADIGCGDVRPEYGISGTPVVVRTRPNAATIYLVAATEPSSFQFHTQLHALDLGTGKDLKPPVEIAPSATLSDGSTLRFDAQHQWARAGLAYANGALYVGIGSHCDQNPYNISGWLLRYNAALTLKQAFHTIETPHGYELASIWMTGFAPAIDPAGNVFVVTGNGDFTRGANDWGESVLRLSPSLHAVSDKFTPASYADLNNGDTDFGSGGVMLLPPVTGQAAPPLAVAIGKASKLYLLNQTKLGGMARNDSGALQIVYPGGNGVWGGPAFYAGPAGPVVFVQTDSDVLHAFSVSTAAAPGLKDIADGTTAAGYGGSMPIVSSNGAMPATGIVWLARRTLPIQLEAYDASTLGAPIFAANAGSWSNKAQGNPFVTPMEANGRVYVPAYKTVAVFGLTP